MDKQIERVIKNLEKNRMRGIYAETAADAVKMVEDMLFEGCTILSGGSVSLAESGVWELINRPCYNFYDRNKPGLTPEEKQDIFKKAIGCDFYFCSSNAVTENGELVNIDGFANRISSILFGPKRVVMIVSTDKIVPDTAAGFLRIKQTVAPKNCIRLGIDNPCVKLGHCVSLEKSDNPAMTDGCSLSTRICRNYLVSGMQAEEGRITVILCGEKLGY